MNIPRLILIGGDAGAGKTQLGALLADQFKFGHPFEKLSVTHHEPDFFFYDKQGNFHFDETKMSEALTQCKVIVKGAMKRKDQIVIISHTFPSFWEKKYYLDLAKKFGYTTQEIICKKPR